MNRTQVAFIVAALSAFIVTVYVITSALNALDVGTPVSGSASQHTINVKELQPTIEGVTLQGGR